MKWKLFTFRQSSSSGAVDPSSQTATPSDAYGRSTDASLSALQKPEYATDSRYAATSSIYNTMMARSQLSGELKPKLLHYL